ncbi:hypothetical protein HUF15_25975 [Streptomyces samsunensis]|uniref:hypothetical protein n=1 Tax=Streptomyces malaysiensis TaxID=92644 RepID=UPI0015826EE2|nr:hypothetical protein [Streptomyces samsunensis]NUH40166.1 hypothetical protein [Streptomyces samsunensis]
MSTASHHVLSPAQLRTARRMADWFMPEVPGFPTNAEADPDESVLRLVLDELHPHTGSIFSSLDAVVDGDIGDYLAHLGTDAPERYELLRILFIGRYLACRPVWSVLGYTGRRPLPIQPGEAEAHLRDDLLGPVRSRGKVYRPTPARTQSPPPTRAKKVRP